MKTYNLFIVELEKTTNDTITTGSGLELYIDTKMDDMGEFNHRVTEGPVVAIPFKYETGVKEDNYFVRYDEKHALNNQAIAYKCQNTGEIKPLAGWSLLEPVEQEKKVTSDLIEVVSLKEELPTQGRVAFTAPWIEELGLKVGDVVGFQENRDYRIKIDGQEYYRTRTEDLLYVVQE